MSVALVQAPQIIKLDLGCGQNPREGFDGVDIAGGKARHALNLTHYPWPWATNSVTELHSSHFVEHLPACEVTEGTRAGQDHFFAFFDECHRVLVPGGTMTVIVPSASSDRAFQDPTHRRFIVAATFAYLSAEWRRVNHLDHYRVECNFEVQANPVIPKELEALHPEAQTRRFNENRNTVLDWHVFLKAIK